MDSYVESIWLPTQGTCTNTTHTHDLEGFIERLTHFGLKMAGRKAHLGDAGGQILGTATA